MANGKPEFTPREEPAADEACDFSFTPTESAYTVRPSPARRQLTPRGEAHNRNVRRLFDRVVPGLPIDAEPPETRCDAEPFAAAIERTLKRLRIDATPWLDELALAWPQLVPPEVARVSRPGKWDNGILYVYVTTSVKLFELRRQHLARIEQAVRAFARDGRVRQVRLMVNAVDLPF